ncbi:MULTISPECIES: restriction endonuclease subunit S [Streptomyces]|uniref:restriction endonuclease subunit S n=1 Tax=Streptomyces TaxID=1883 RepID=UPI00192A04E6|nr:MULTISPECIES: restriction endonuclease subunit S [unclassified Streptomyces]CAD5950705.1 protein of unknown function [Streptomyces sp. KY70]CAD5984593.1 protein of unknown function [Streptomyces sp. KY75]
MTVHWQPKRLGSFYDVRDERAGQLADSLPLLSVSQMHGVVPRAELSGDGGRADSLVNYKVCEPGDIVLNRMSAYNGALGVARQRGLVSPDYLVMEPREGVNADFVVAWLKTPRGVYEMTSRLRGIGSADVAQVRTPRINESDLRLIPVEAPSPQEQRAIADYLDRETSRIDTLVEEQQRLIAMLRERRASVIDSALTPTELWDRRRVKYIGQTNLGKMLDAGRAAREGDRMRPYVRAADVRADGSVNLVDLNEMPFSDAEMEFFDLRADDVLLIEGGATVGRPGFVFDSVPGVAFQKTVNRLRLGEQANARFVYWSMLRLYETAYYTTHFSAVSFVHLTGEKLREIELWLPPLDEQRAIAAHLDDQTARIDSLIAETERFIDLARERRSALITAAVTGQVDVREAA